MKKTWGQWAGEVLAGAGFLAAGSLLLSPRFTTCEVFGLFFVMVAARI